MASCLEPLCVLSNQEYVTAYAVSDPAISLPDQVRGVFLAFGALARKLQLNYRDQEAER